MKVLVTGGRTFNDYGLLATELAALKPTAIIHGGADGADRLAGIYANVEHIPCTAYPADWGTHGKAAGPIRNKRMLEEGLPDVVLAMPGGKGTAHMKKIATAAGVTVVDAALPREQFVIGT